MILLRTLAIPLWALLALPEPTPIPPTLTLRDGRVMYLKAPPRTEGSRVVFTTLAGKTYSLEASEVASFVAAPPTPTRPAPRYNPQDSHALGAIARQERSRTGKTTDLSASRRSPRPTKAPAKKTPAARKAKPKARAAETRTPAAAASPTPTPAPR